MKESNLETDAKNLARLFGWVAFKGDSRPGGADQIFLRGGVGVAVEFKYGENDQQENQKNEQKIMEESEIPYFLVYTLEEFKAVLVEINKWRVSGDEEYQSNSGV